MSCLKYCLLIFLATPLVSFANTSVSHTDPIAMVLFVITALFFFSLVGRYLAHCTGQPGVLGELLIGVVVGNVGYYFGLPVIGILREGSNVFSVTQALLQGKTLADAVTSAIPEPKYALQLIAILSKPEGAEYLKIGYIVDFFSRYGVVFLLFKVGLETSLEELKQTGKESFYVAILGVLVPMGLGFAVAYCLMPTASYAACLFVAATLSATSIGITARVLAQVGQLQTREAKTILGAATIDDVLGLILLSVVSSIVITGHIDALGIAHIAGFALLFFIGIFTLGPLVLKAVIPRLSFLELWEAKLFLSFIFLMLLAYAATLVQMAAIIGAFAAGVVLHDAYFKQEHFDEKNKQSTIEELVAPLESILAPIFFMMIGVQVKIETFFNVHVLILAVGLIVAAIIGKLFSGFGANRNDDRLLVGIGMMPRGEVGLVFASIGSTIGVISDDLFSAIVLMVVVTTFIAPILLKARLTTHPPL